LQFFAGTNGLSESSVIPARRKVGVTVLVVLALALSILRPVDRVSTSLTDSALQNAALTYATARLINGAISVLKGTEVGLAVGGTVTFTIGEVLDPLHDLIEQLSTVMLVALTSLGVQKILIVVLASGLFSWLLLACGLLLLGDIWLRRLAPLPKDVLCRTFFVLLFTRFSMVLVVLANQLVFDHFLAADYQQANRGLAVAGVQLEQARIANQAEAEAADAEAVSFLNLWQTVRNTLNPAQRLAAIRAAAEQTLEQALALITVFVLQTILLPLFFLLLLYRIAKLLATATYRTWI
jgi:hypothetical protein